MVLVAEGSAVVHVARGGVVVGGAAGLGGELLRLSQLAEVPSGWAWWGEGGAEEEEEKCEDGKAKVERKIR